MKKFAYNSSDYSYAEREKQEGFREVGTALRAMPPLPLGDDLTIRVIPTFGGLAARFLIGRKDRPDIDPVSVYLDTCERAGYYDDEVYWEIYPGEDHGDVSRYALEDIDGLFAGLRASLQKSAKEGAP